MPISTIGQNGLAQSRILTAVQQPAGAVLQVVNATYATNVNTTSSTLITTGLTASITPTSSSSKIYVMINNPMRRNDAAGVTFGMYISLYRNSTNIYTPMTNLGYSYNVSSLAQSWIVAFNYLDSPATTSATSYTMYFACTFNGTMSSCVDNNTATITLMEIAA